MSGAANLRTMVRGSYDLQKLRIQTGNRIVANFKAKLGQAPSKPEEEMDAVGKGILLDLRASYKKLTDGLKRFPRQITFKGDGLISDYTELCLIGQYVDLERSEEEHFRRLGQILRDYPIYTQFLEGVKGCGPAMSGVIISEFDIHLAKYPSSLWKYAGLDVAENGAGRSRRAEHLVDVAYTNKAGEEATRKSITFNPWLKTKLYVLGTCLMKTSGPYKKIYDDYKHRLENHPNWQEKTKGHRHNAAIRYMLKIFLVDLYTNWRELEGLTVAPSYQEAKLGHRHAA